MRAPPQLRFVLATRRELRVGLHRLRLEGELTEIRAADLRFDLPESRALLEAAGVELSESALTMLHGRTEGWAAGLRLAALSLARDADPERFATEFSGSERTVADYLFAEVLERQPEDVRRLLLRTSILDRVSGPLADFLTRDSDGERILQELEDANAFVVSLDAGRTWFRYHRLFADLLQLELRRSAPGDLRALHLAAAQWYAGHGYGIEAIRHAQAAPDWRLAGRLLSDRWLSLRLGGQLATAYELLAGFPASVVAADPELVGLMACVYADRGSLDEADRHLGLAADGLASVAEDRRGHLQLLLPVLRLCVALERQDLPRVAEEAQRLLAPGAALRTAELGLGDDLRALALINLGIAELASARANDAELHLEQGIALARRIDQPHLAITGLGHFAIAGASRSCSLALERSGEAIELAQQRGWDDDPVVTVAYVVRGITLLWQGQLEDGERSLAHAERALGAHAEPAAAILLHIARGLLDLARGSAEDALATFVAAQRAAEALVTPSAIRTRTDALRLHTLVQLRQTDRAEAEIAQLDERERAAAEIRSVAASLRLAQGDPAAATRALAPIIDGAVRPATGVWLVDAFLVEAIARDALGDAGEAERALEHALDLAEPDGLLLPFLLHPAPELLGRQARNGTKHAALLAAIRDLLAGKLPPAGDAAKPLCEPLSEREMRILRFLPTNLSAPEIASELYVSANTVRTHVRHLYAKLDAHSRAQAVERARGLGLLAPSLRRS
jgi:LuxR family maltose regulon positive regulatory protein